MAVFSKKGNTRTHEKSDDRRTYAFVRTYGHGLMPQFSYALPKVCPCCMSPTTRSVRYGERHRKVSYSSGNKVETTTSRSATFCICEECETHMQEYGSKSLVILGFACVLNTAAMLAVLPLVRDGGFSMAATVMLCLVAVVAGAVICALVARHSCRLRELPGGHVNREWFVKFAGDSFIFANVEYAKLFTSMNPMTQCTVESRSFGYRYTGRYIPNNVGEWLGMVFSVSFLAGAVSTLVTFWHVIDAL